VIGDDDVRPAARRPSEERHEARVRLLRDRRRAPRERFLPLMKVNVKVLGGERLPPELRRVLRGRIHARHDQQQQNQRCEARHARCLLQAAGSNRDTTRA
jgi:hypothetical protein